ncbi:MAG: hypothetical protein M3O46_06095 [Myxococcota bacterium]|nr:hypothetical protein [Myxococcota bacterium]
MKFALRDRLPGGHLRVDVLQLALGLFGDFAGDEGASVGAPPWTVVPP